MSRFERGEIKTVIRRANGSHKGERTIGVSFTQEIREIPTQSWEPTSYINVRVMMFDEPITVGNGETLSIKGPISNV